MVGNARIGMRVSKKVRKKVRKAIKSAANPFVRDFATAAMAAAGRARREGPRASEDDGADGSQRRAHIMCGETRVHIDGSKIAEAFRKAAADGLRTFLKGIEEGLREAQAESGEAQPKPRAKPKAKARPKAKSGPESAAAPKAKPRPRKPRTNAAKPASRAPGA